MAEVITGKEQQSASSSSSSSSASYQYFGQLPVITCKSPHPQWPTSLITHLSCSHKRAITSKTKHAIKLAKKLKT